jgi:hypothetical protein
MRHLSKKLRWTLRNLSKGIALVPRTGSRPSQGGMTMITRSEMLARWGLIDGPGLIVEASKEGDIIWRVAIYAPGNPVACLATSTAVQLAEYVQKNGDEELASQIIAAVEEARRHTRNESSHEREIGASHCGFRG